MNFTIRFEVTEITAYSFRFCAVGSSTKHKCMDALGIRGLTLKLFHHIDLNETIDKVRIIKKTDSII